MEENKVYELVFPNGAVTKARLHKMRTYPATGMPADYIFEYLDGNDSLAKTSPLGNNLFPFPSALISMIKVKEVV